MLTHLPFHLAAGAALLTAPVACAQVGEPVEQGPKNVPEFEPEFPEQTRAPAVATQAGLSTEIVLEGLEHPWGMAFLPDETLLVTERAGRLRVISDGALVPEAVSGMPEVLSRKQGGLLDVAVGPTFAQDRIVYWTYSKPLAEGTSATAAARGRLSEDLSEVTDVEDIFVQDPPSPTPVHYGSRIVFDDAGHAFVTTGEHSTRDQRIHAQDLGKTYGKIVRVNLDGSVPDDNPFVQDEAAEESIWSYGHRNVQGAAMHPDTGELWAVEHGPQGGDELNLIEPGSNYGWPIISYGENYGGSPIGEGLPRQSGMAPPRYYWDPVIAPSGMTFYDGTLFSEWQADLLVASLDPGALVRLELNGDKVVGEEWLLDDEGRIRDVEVAPDGAVLVITDEANGRLLRLTPDPAT